MYEALKALVKDEIQEEIQTAVQEAETRATDRSRVTDIKNLMQKLSMDAKAAMEILGISAADQRRYLAML